MNRTLLEGTIDNQLSLHEQVHDEKIVNRPELARGIAGAVELLISDEVAASVSALLANQAERLTGNRISGVDPNSLVGSSSTDFGNGPDEKENYGIR